MPLTSLQKKIHFILSLSSYDAEKGEDVLETITNHFDVKDKYENFQVKYGEQSGEDEINFTVRGLKRELGQTLNSTGLTMWMAAYHLCDYIYKTKAEKFKGKKVCELGAGLGMV